MATKDRPSLGAKINQSGQERDAHRPSFGPKINQSRQERDADGPSLGATLFDIRLRHNRMNLILSAGAALLTCTAPLQLAELSFSTALRTNPQPFSKGVKSTFHTNYNFFLHC